MLKHVQHDVSSVAANRPPLNVDPLQFPGARRDPSLTRLIERRPSPDPRAWAPAFAGEQPDGLTPSRTPAHPLGGKIAIVTSSFPAHAGAQAPRS